LIRARYAIGFVVGLVLLALGLVFGFVLLGPCGGNGCGFITGGVLDSIDSNLLSWGMMVLGIGILVASLLMGRRTATSKNGPAA
jgi:hypothetical protein